MKKERMVGSVGDSAVRRAIAVLAALVLVACTENEAPGPSIQHPTSEGRVHPMPPIDTLRLPAAANSAPNATLPEHLRLPIGPPRTLLGTLEAPEPEVLGAIRAVDIDRSGRILVLDGQARDVRIFDLESGEVRFLGGYGQGPGQFVTPETMVIDASGRLLVAERHGAVNVFVPDGDSLRFTERLRLGGDLWGMCTLDDEIHAHGMQVTSTNALRRFNANGEEIGAFGEVYRTRNNIVRYQISRGHVACVPTSGLVALAPSNLPELRSYDPSSGTIRWWIAIEGFRPISVMELPSGATGMGLPEDGWHVSTGLVASTDRDALLLQVTYAERASSGSTDAPEIVRHTFVIDVGEGRGYYAGDMWPHIVRWDARGLIAMREAPHPELLFYPASP